MAYWAKVRFAKSRKRADIKTKIVKSNRKPKLGGYHMVYGPFDSRKTLQTYLYIGGVR